jgi:putative ABC transport system permease protein
MTLLLGTLTIGLILTFLAVGVFISFRLFNFPDLTTEGSFALGGAVVAAMITSGSDPLTAVTVAFIAGAVAGACTGTLRGFLRIQELLAGILVMTSLYSINLRIMGKSNLPILSGATLFTAVESWSARVFGSGASFAFLGWNVSAQGLSVLGACAACVLVICFLVYLFFRTDLGTAMRAVGNNPQMIRTLAVSTEWTVVLGIAMANGFIAMAGGLLAQYQGFADVQMGIGMLVWGIASLIIGESLVGLRALGLIITGIVMGSVLFRLLVSIALQWGINPNDLKLISAILVLLIILVPQMLQRRKGAPARA